jgi:hypothetical protein
VPDGQAANANRGFDQRLEDLAGIVFAAARCLDKGQGAEGRGNLWLDEAETFRGHSGRTGGRAADQDHPANRLWSGSNPGEDRQSPDFLTRQFIAEGGHLRFQVERPLTMELDGGLNDALQQHVEKLSGVIE